MSNLPLDKSARHALRMGSFILTMAFVLSFLVNLLRLAGPLFMILIYDRVLTSRSVETLVALFAMVVVLMCVLGLVDYARKRMLARFAAQFQERLEGVILGASSQNQMFERGRAKPAAGLDEVDGLRGFFHSGSLIAVLDFVWTPMFVLVVFILHPMLGWICTAGIAAIFLIVMVQMIFIGGREHDANAASGGITALKNMIVASRDVVRGQEMNGGFKSRWSGARQESRDKAIALNDWKAWFDTLSSTTVMVVRYSVLAAGAYLTLQGQLTVGAMVACTFLVTRVLSPVDRFMGQIPKIKEALENWAKLKKTLASRGPETEDPFGAEVGNPRARLSLTNVSVKSPITNTLLLKSINLDVSPGQVVEVLGSSGRGKTILAETILGIWKRNTGTILCDGIHIGRLNDHETAKTFGYVPESPDFVSGTLAENISHLDPDATPQKIIAAARKACLHAFISALPDGYETQIDATAAIFSKGQQHQLALARAVYHEPEILVIDEPDAMLTDRVPKTFDATLRGITARGGVVVFMARRPLAIRLPRTQMELKDGKLVTLGAVDAQNTGHTKTGKVTVLSEQKTDAPMKKSVRG